MGRRHIATLAQERKKNQVDQEPMCANDLVVVPCLLRGYRNVLVEVVACNCREVAAGSPALVTVLETVKMLDAGMGVGYYTSSENHAVDNASLHSACMNCLAVWLEHVHCTHYKGENHMSCKADCLDSKRLLLLVGEPPSEREEAEGLLVARLGHHTADLTPECLPCLSVYPSD
jgi:hypothetical protein